MSISLMWLAGCFGADNPHSGVLGQNFQVPPTPPTPTPSVLPPVKIINNRLPYGEVGRTYFYAFNAAGGSTTYTWSVDQTDQLANDFNMEFTPEGVLRTTLIEEKSNGELVLETFEESNKGSITLNITATDAQIEGSSDTREYQLIVSDKKVVIYSTELNEGMVGQPYSSFVNAWGGTRTYNWTDINGVLTPLGLSIDAQTGEVSGTIASGSQGEHIVELKVEDSSVPATNETKLFLLTIKPAGSLFLSAKDLSTQTLLGNSLPQVDVGTSYYDTASIVALNGTGPYYWRQVSGSWPDGVEAVPDPSNTSELIILGTPEEAGFFYITYEVSDSSSNKSTAEFSFYVVPPTFDIATGTVLPIYIGQYNTTVIDYTGGLPPLTFTIDSITGADALADVGLSFNAATGVITGTPEESLFLPGGEFEATGDPPTYNVDITVSGEDFYFVPAEDTDTITLALQPEKLEITTDNSDPLELPLGYEVPEIQFKGEGGIGDYEWSISCLPDLGGGSCEADYNIMIDSSTGELQGAGEDILTGLTVSNIAERGSGTYVITLDSADLSNIKQNMKIVLSGTTNFNGSFKINKVDDDADEVFITAASGLAAEAAGSADIKAYYLKDYQLSSIEVTLNDASDLWTSDNDSKTFNIDVQETDLTIAGESIIPKGKELIPFKGSSEVISHRDFENIEISSVTEIGSTGIYTFTVDPTYVTDLADVQIGDYIMISGSTNPADFFKAFRITDVRSGSNEFDVKIGTTGLSYTAEACDGFIVVRGGGYSVQTSGGISPFHCTLNTTGYDELPRGLGLVEDECKIVGVPETAEDTGTCSWSGTGGTGYNIQVQAVDFGEGNPNLNTNETHNASKDLNLFIDAADLEIATSAVQNATVYKSYSTYRIEPEGGVPPYTWSFTQIDGANTWADYGLTMEQDGDDLIIRMDGVTEVQNAFTGNPPQSDTLKFEWTLEDSATPKHVLNSDVNTTGNLTSGSATISNIPEDDIDFISADMPVSGTGIPVGAVVVSVDRGARTVTLDQTATATATGEALTFEYDVSITVSFPEVVVNISETTAGTSGRDIFVVYQRGDEVNFTFTTDGGIPPFEDVVILDDQDLLTDPHSAAPGSIGLGLTFANQGDGVATLSGTLPDGANYGASLTFQVQGEDSAGNTGTSKINLRMYGLQRTTNGTDISPGDSSGNLWGNWDIYGSNGRDGGNCPFSAGATFLFYSNNYNYYWGDGNFDSISAFSQTWGQDDWRTTSYGYVYLEAGETYDWDWAVNDDGYVFINGTQVFGTCSGWGDGSESITPTSSDTDDNPYTPSGDGWYLYEVRYRENDDPHVFIICITDNESNDGDCGSTCSVCCADYCYAYTILQFNNFSFNQYDFMTRDSH